MFSFNCVFQHRDTSTASSVNVCPVFLFVFIIIMLKGHNAKILLQYQHAKCKVIKLVCSNCTTTLYSTARYRCGKFGV